MDKIDRVHELHQILSQRRMPITKAVLAARMNCSEKTVKRTADWMVDCLHAPIIAAPSGYFYDQSKAGPSFELPGLWFSPEELIALVSMRTLLASAQPGLLDDKLAPINKRIDELLGHRTIGLADWQARIRILQIAARPTGEHFNTVADALARREQITITYTARSSGTSTTRTVSPQRLSHYRDNWYMDAWCYTKNALRVFSVEQITRAALTGQPAQNIDESTLDAELAGSYGIFAGQANDTAVLQFNARAARWVGREQWHPEQTNEMLDSGGCRLSFPVGRTEELVRDVARWGSDVEVIAPEALRLAVVTHLRNALDQYQA